MRTYILSVTLPAKQQRVAVRCQARTFAEALILVKKNCPGFSARFTALQNQNNG